MSKLNHSLCKLNCFTIVHYYSDTNKWYRLQKVSKFTPNFFTLLAPERVKKERLTLKFVMRLSDRQLKWTYPMEQHALKNENNCMNTNIYSYLETSGGQNSNPYSDDVHFLNTRAD